MGAAPPQAGESQEGIQGKRQEEKILCEVKETAAFFDGTYLPKCKQL